MQYNSLPIYCSDKLAAAILITCRNVANKLKAVSLKCKMWFTFISRQKIDTKNWSVLIWSREGFIFHLT